jgi:alpha-tubulin suppressor-like RCC1 family protein
VHGIRWDRMGELVKTLRNISLLLVFVFAQEALCAESHAGQVVWWGQDIFWKNRPSDRTNGVVESDDDILSNVVAIAALHLQAFLLTSDGAVFTCGLTGYERGTVPTGLSNVVSIIQEGGSLWAIKRDSNVARWGGDEDNENIVAGLSNITTIAWAGYRSYLALKNDGTVLGFRFDGSPSIDPTTGLPRQESDHSPVQQVKVRGQVLSNVVALASMGYTPLALKNDGMVLRLGYQTPGMTPAEPVVTQIDKETIAIDMGGESWRTPYHYTSADPVMIDGKILRNVAALAAAGGHALALKSNGTVVAWGNNHYGETAVPDNLSNVVAISAAEHLSLALKRDGTVAAWGGNYFGQTSVPAGLSNVVAVAAGGWFSLAVTTGAVPSSVYIRPHGRLEEMEREADLIFKGQVISTRAITNASFPDWAKPHATRFRLVSVLKGKSETDEPVLWHYTAGPMAWGGGSEPSWYQFETGQCYLVFVAKLDRPDYLYTPPSDATNRPNEYRQLYRDCVTRTLDDRTISGVSIKDAHWQEFRLLLNDTNPTNQLYAIERLDHLSLAGRRDDEWSRTGDFKRGAVLSAMLPLATNGNETVANRAIASFAVETNVASRLEPFVVPLTKIANGSAFSSCRLSAIAALSDVNGDAVSNSLSHLLRSPDENIRVGAVRLLPRFRDAFAEQWLQELGNDLSANVRSVVADVIGEGKYTRLIPILAELFADPVGKDTLIEPMTMENLKAGQRWSNIGDVHTSAGLALVMFDANQVSDILKTNLDDPGFHINFVAKLAEKDAEPWLPELVSILETREKYVASLAGLPGDDPRKYSDIHGDIILIGTYGKCWEDLRQYLLKKSPEDLAGGKYDRYMDLLEKMVWHNVGCAGCSRDDQQNLYALYRSKRLEKRADKVRQRFKDPSGWWLDEFDRNNLITK